MVSPKLHRTGPVVAAVALLIAGCSSTHPHPASTTTTSTSSTTAPIAPPTTTTATTPTTLSAGRPLPSGFTVTDLTWVSNDQGWALGTAPCAHPPCTSVAHTLDGGHTWAGLPAPRAYLETESPAVSPAPPCSATVACVQGIRFADANIGYAFGVSSLWLTTDGGHSWSLRSTDLTDALEVAGAMVVRVTHPGDVGCPPGCPYRAQATAVGSTSWHSLPTPDLAGVGPALAVEGHNRYLGAFGHTAGGAGDAHTQFARSTDDGAHWARFADPCGVTASGNEADATAISAAPGGNLAVGCTARSFNEAGFVVVSADAGATFGPHRGGLLNTVPPGEHIAGIAAATGPRLAALVGTGTDYDIVVSNDGGIDWTTTHTEAAPATGLTNPYIGFQDATTGRAVLDPRTVLTTTDGGGHWSPFTFP